MSLWSSAWMSLLSLMGYADHSHYDPSREIPDLTGKVAIVTGVSEETIGHYCVELLATHGCKVYAASRNEQKTLHCLSLIEKAHPTLRGRGLLHYHHLDQSSCSISRLSGEAFLAKETRLDFLVNNAACIAVAHAMTSEGIERTIATNHVGMFVFTLAVLPLLKTTAKLPHTDVRIVVHSSRGYIGTSRYKFESLEDLNDVGTSDAYLERARRYNISKFMNLLFTHELQRRLDVEDSPITVIALHPGAVRSTGAAACNPWYIFLLFRIFGIGPYEGAFTTLFAATSAEVAAAPEKYKGKYLLPYGRLEDPIPQARDETLAKLLWETTEKAVADVFARQRS